MISFSDSDSGLESSFEEPIRHLRPNIVVREASRHAPSIGAKQPDIGCPICYQEFCVEEAPPLVLTSCGHTVCGSCLVLMLETCCYFTCPVCRTQTYQNLDALPTNYALLEHTGKASGKPKCDKHHSEIVGYCRDDDTLLCGICAFDHLKHSSFLLDSPQAEATALQKRKLLEDDESRLKKWQKRWEKADKILKRDLTAFNSDANLHIAALKRTEMKLIDEVRQGVRSCIGQIKGVVKDPQLKAKSTEIQQRLKQFRSEISQVSSLRQNFNGASIVERLKALKPKELETTLPSIKDCLPIVRQLNVEVDYEAAIEAASFPLKLGD